MSFFGDNDFSFLDTYRDKCNDEDESDDDRSQIYIGSSHPMQKTMNKTAPILVLTVLTLSHPKALLLLILRWRARKIVMGSHLLGKIQKQKSE